MGVIGRKVAKTELVEIVIPANNAASKIQFPDIPNLRDTHLWDLQTYTESDLPFSILTQGQAVVTFPILQVTFLTLQSYNGKQFVDNHPIIDFLDLSTSGAFTFNPERFIGQKVNWPKSFITFSTLAPFLPPFPARSLLLKIGYSDIGKGIDKADLATDFKNMK